VTGAHLPRGGIYIKQLGEEPTLIVSNIDLGNARKGIVAKTVTFSELGYESLAKRYGMAEAYAQIIYRLIGKIRGKIGFFGHVDLATSLDLAIRLRKLGCKVSGEKRPTLLDVLRSTKDPDEIEKIKQTGRGTCAVIERVQELLSKAKVRAGKLYVRKQPLTIGRVKSFIGQVLAERQLTAPEGLILAVGRRSSDPHYMGSTQDMIRANQPIMLDLFPQGPSGYRFDMTRTFVIGRAPAKIRVMFDSVLDAQMLAFDLLTVGEPAAQIVSKICKRFEEKGFLTIRQVMGGESKAQRSGFIHSLGHGVGLTIGEYPFLSLLSEDILREGHVTTVEPGLYDPHVGGVRIEDIAVLGKAGARILASAPKELEI
jgi:Xaa-Pro aminopeptidase